MITAVQRWGNSLALRIPAAYANESKIREGSPVNIALKDGVIVVKPLRKRRSDLASLVKLINADNLHGEEFDAKPIGREVW